MLTILITLQTEEFGCNANSLITVQIEDFGDFVTD